MDESGFRNAVESTMQTELDRIGSSKLLVALTGADLSTDAVLAVAADSEAAAAAVFEDWADDAAPDELRDTYSDMAAEERTHLERVLAELDEYEPSGTGATHDHLRNLDEPIERVAAGFVGRGLLALRTHTQLVSFFVNEPDERLADLFRELKAETEEQIERGVALLAEHCESEADWEQGKEAAEAVVRVAYEEYVAALEGMGINPKSVC